MSRTTTALAIGGARWILSAFVLSALPAVAVAQAQVADGDPPALRFNWTPGLRARVEVSLTSERTFAGNTDRKVLRASYTQRVQRQGKELLIVRENFNGWRGSARDRSTVAIERLAELIPTFRVSTTGDFAGIEGAATARAAAATEAGGGPLQRLDKKVFDTVTRSLALESIARTFWNVSVGAWSRIALKPGQSRVERRQTSISELGDEHIDLRITFEYGSSVPCVAGAEPRRCVELRMHSQPDPEEVAQRLARLRSTRADRQQLIGLESSEEVVIVAEPGTLLPHRITTRRQNRIVSRPRGGLGEPEELVEKTERTYVYAYDS